MHQLKVKLIEAIVSVMPISIAVTILFCCGLVHTNVPSFIFFLISVVFVILGLTLFQLGAQVALTPIGEHVGSTMPKINKWWLLIIICFILGVIGTVAEPDLQVLSTQVADALNNPEIRTYIVWIVAIGVGIFLVAAVLRTFLKIKLSVILFICYGIVLVIALFTDVNFLPMAFDSGGVTTGPITVPFLLAIGIGIASVKGGNSKNDDSFGIVALCSVGPIIAVLVLGLISGAPSGYSSTPTAVGVESVAEIPYAIVSVIPKYLFEVGITILPIIAFFLVFNFLFIKLPKRQLARIGIGLAYTYVGLVIFMMAVNVGFMPIGIQTGVALGSLGEYKALLIPIGVVIGLGLAVAEPAVHVLCKQVEEVSGGTIKSRTILITIAIANGIAVGLAMVRIVTGISIAWILIPFYVIAFALMFFVPKVYTAIAFDSGGVVSGPMTTTFLLPLALGACGALGGNILTDAFGVVAFVAMTPLVAVQSVGLVVKLKQNAVKKRASTLETKVENEIIEF